MKTERETDRERQRERESCMKVRINLKFFFALLCGASKGFMKACTFIKPFEAPQRRVEIKI